jgi:hypothetical protein
MVRLPWRDSGEDTSQDSDESAPHLDVDPVVSCQFQDGKLFVYEDQVFIERTDRSKFSDKWIAIEQVDDVTYSKRIVISYIQIAQEGFDTSGGGMLSAPVDENTLHFGYGKRDCAKRARDEILERVATN